MRDTPQRNASAWSFLAGPDGRWLIENGPEFLAEIGDPNPDYDAPLFAVRNLGFIRVTRYGALIEITLHPAAVSPQAVDTVISSLSSMPARLFRIKHLQAEWQEELAPSAGCAAARLIELVCCWRGG